MAARGCTVRLPSLDSTHRYYDEHAEEFCASTFSIDMSELYRPFVARLPEGGRVLEAGCGSGRDALAFTQMGFQVEAFDASAEIVRIARVKTNLDIQVDTFDTFHDDQGFDGIWACASLIHHSRTDLGHCLLRLRDKLVPGGVLYASFKNGEQEEQRGLRVFLDLTQMGVIEIVDGIPGIEVLQIWPTPDLRGGRELERWTNALLIRSCPGLASVAD